MDALKPGVRVVAEMFPRFGATDYSTEVTRLLAARPDVILSTSWGGDLVTWSARPASGGCSNARPSCCRWPRPRCRSSAEHGGGACHRHPGRPLEQPSEAEGPGAAQEFVDSYRAKYNEYPIYPCHHMAQAISAMQAGFAKAIAAKSGGWPNDQELADAFRGLTFDTPTSSITLREDGQGLEDQIVGLSSFTERFPFAVPKEMMMFPAAMVITPVGHEERRVAEVPEAGIPGTGARAGRGLGTRWGTHCPIAAVPRSLRFFSPHGRVVFR